MGGKVAFRNARSLPNVSATSAPLVPSQGQEGWGVAAVGTDDCICDGTIWRQKHTGATTANKNLVSNNSGV